MHHIKIKCQYISTLNLYHYTLNFVRVESVALSRGKSPSQSLVRFWKGESRKLNTREGKEGHNGMAAVDTAPKEEGGKLPFRNSL